MRFALPFVRPAGPVVCALLAGLALMFWAGCGGQSDQSNVPVGTSTQPDAKSQAPVDEMKNFMNSQQTKKK